jgi:signal transduction histidine kinase/ligand-binding sensor domain-containing protein/AraC-like DNA-binding protein
MAVVSDRCIYTIHFRCCPGIFRKLMSILCLIQLASIVYVSGQDYRFKHINRNDGLSQSNVTCILQDHKGFMWFGTRDGLNRYDGYTITVYRNDPVNPRSLSHNYIRTIFEDNQHKLWVGTEDGGLSLYDRATDDFTNYLHNPRDIRSISSNKVRAITQDSKGRLWIGTGGGGLNRFDAKEKIFTCYRQTPADASSLSGNDIEDILEDRDGSLWIATWNAGLNKFRIDEEKFIHYRKEENNIYSLSSNYLKKLYIDAGGTLWIGTTEGGLNRYDKTQNRFIRYIYTPGTKHGISNNDVLSITEDDAGNLWIGTQNGSINILNKSRNKFHYINHDKNNPDGLNNGSVYSLYKDQQGNIWVGTFSGGINFCDRTANKFRHFTNNNTSTGLNNENVLSIYEDDSEIIYIGTDGGGLNIYQRHSKEFTHLVHATQNTNSIPSNYPLCMYEDREGYTWLGSFYGKVSLFNKQTYSFQKINFNVDIKHVAAITEDTITGKIWMGTWGEGLIIYDKQNQKVQHYIPDATKEESLSHAIVFSIYQDQQGNMWVGTEGGGLNLYDRKKDQFIHFQYNRDNPQSISNNIVNVIYEDRSGNLWIGTQGGLNLLDRNKSTFTTYTIKDGLPNNVIQAIEEDRHGNLWLSTNKGISRLDTKAVTFRNYEIADGLQSNSFNRLSSFRNKQGTIYFGGINGLDYFHPDSIADNNFIPPVYFTELQVFNKPVNFREDHAPIACPIDEAQVITLSYKESVFSLAFAALNYTSPEKNQYAYRLEGFDERWNFVGSQRKATYTNLDPGEYILRVKATNNDGIWNEQGNSIRIIITPPFWKTWWAKIIYAILLLASLFVLRYILVQRMKVRNRLEMDDIKLRFYANISHEFRTPLTLILGPLNQLTTSTDIHGKDKQMLDLIHRNGQHLLRLINQLMHIYELDAGFMKLNVMQGDIISFVKGIKEAFQFTAEKRNIVYNFSTSVPTAEKYFDPDKLEKIILNILSNAFKYTPDQGKISVSIMLFEEGTPPVPEVILKKKRHAKSFLCIRITDSGEGISQAFHEKVFDPFFRVEREHRTKEGTGIGLALARQLAVLHHGDILLKSDMGEGCEFSVWLPVGQEAFASDEFANKPYDITDRLLDTQTTYGIPDTKPADPTDQSELRRRPLLLVVEDNSDIRQFIKLNFDTTFLIEEAENGEIGFQKACDSIPDIIISDVMMPVLDGVEMCSRIKKDIRTSHIPVVLLTARSDEDFQLHAFKAAHADDYIVKPFSTNVLLAKLSNIIELRESFRKKYYRDFIANPTAPATTSPDAIFIKKAVEAVEQNIEDPDFNVETFCRDLGMSQTNLYRKLQSILGVSGNQFIKDIRMKRAVQLLESGQHPVHEIAYRVGFADANYFSKSFKKQFGVLPSAYRPPQARIPGSL